MSLNPIRPWRNIDRRPSRRIMVGNVPVGGDAPISVQTMTNTDSTDVRATLAQVIAAAMIKHLPRAAGDLLEQYIGPVQASLAVKKARLLTATPSAKPAPLSPYPTRYQLDQPKLELLNHANLFCREGLDIGTRAFLPHLPKALGALRVADLGCGNGELLAWLRDHKQVSGYGLEIDPDNIAACIDKGVNVIEQNLDLGLGNFASDSFDMVVMTQALQAVHYPDKLLKEMLRVGRECIITFPNFGHWRCRWYLASKGRMPVSEFLPYTWYNTPNIHFCTFEDFERLCQESGARVRERLAVDRDHKHGWASRLWPNLLGEIGIYRVTGPSR